MMFAWVIVAAYNFTFLDMMALNYIILEAG